MLIERDVCGIYKITNPKGKVYIGQSIDCRSRLYRYRTGKCQEQAKLYRSIVKYGWDKHTFEIIHQCTAEELNELEIYYIELYQCYNTKHGLNLRSGGDRPKWSQESKDKLSASMKGLNTWMKGKKLSEETRQKISKSLLGNTRGLGYKHTEASLIKISEASKKRKGIKRTHKKKVIG